MIKRTTLLCILDGFGLNPDSYGNAINQARKPTFDGLFGVAPSTVLTTHGERVGLPAGQMGNSEVGHLNIGAGRVIEQWLVRIQRELTDGTVEKRPEYQAFINQWSQSKKPLHVIGLLSDGGVHSHQEHLRAMIKKLRSNCENEIVLHLITDGRDVAPQQAQRDLEKLIGDIKPLSNVRIATVVGRFFAMDRDKRWERTEKAFRAFTEAAGTPCSDLVSEVRASYARGITDEFLEPLVVSGTGIDDGDPLLFWNFREDRMRQMVAALAKEDWSHFSRGSYDVKRPILCFTDYDSSLQLPQLFHPMDIVNHLGEVVSRAGLSQLRVAETEKYPHVTYFLNGGIENAYKGEERALVPSPRDVKTYDLKPEMSARGVTDIVVRAVENRTHDLIIVNLANCDMVGHTGVMEAAISAVETVDECLGRMIAAIRKNGGQALIIADHGNADQLINYETKEPHTAHTTFPVPCILVGREDIGQLRLGGALCDVAPTILKMMEVAQPTEMTGRALY